MKIYYFLSKKIIRETTRRGIMGVALAPGLLLLPSCGPEEKQADFSQHPDLFSISAKDCAGCHQEIFEEWRDSMHAQSSPMKDPIHGAMYRKLMGSPTESGLTKKGKFPVCLNCHVPLAARAQETKVDKKPVYQEGVTCVACHGVKDFKGSTNNKGKPLYGIRGFVYSGRDKTLAGVSGKNYSPRPGPGQEYHPLPIDGQNTVLKTNQVCQACHEKRSNFHGVPVCRTGEEHREVGQQADCVSCHMPVVNGRASHRMLAGHGSEKDLSRGIRLLLKKGPQQSTIRVVLENRLPHNYPTGAPFRNLTLRLTGVDQQGKVVWQNYQQHPAKEDPRAWLRLVFGDEKGKPVGPPKAKKILKDSRLKPYEKREVVYELPTGKAIARVKAELAYWLVLPAQARGMGAKWPPHLKQPKIVGRASLRL